MSNIRIFSIICILLSHHTNLLIGLQEIRIADIRISHDSKYIPAYHLHTIDTSIVDTLQDCIYLCQNNDYCRTANYYQFNMDILCTLFEENSYVGRIVSVISTISIVISFNLCPNGFSEPEYICFGLPSTIQAPTTIQNVLNQVRFIQQWLVEIYYPIIFPTRFYVPSFLSGLLQIYEWPSLNLLSNMTFPLSIYSFDMNLQEKSYILTSGGYDLYFYSREQNLTSSSSTYYPAVLSNKYIAVLSNGNSKIYIRNSTTGTSLFNITIPSTANWWARIINEQLYISSTSGLRQIDLSQGTSAIPVVLIANLSCKQMFLDASGRLYLEKNDGTKANSFVYDLYGNLLATYTNGSRLIGKASKYTFYLLKNLQNPLVFYQYP